MTNPAFQQQQVPAAQRPWVQQPGGYDPGGQQQQPQGQPVMPSQMQQQQPQQQLPPQMQQQQTLLQDSQSPLAGMQPVLPQWQPRQGQQQQQQQAQPQQQFQQQPQQQQFPPAQQQQAAPVNVNDMILQGPGVPAELQGRRMSEAISIYNGLRQTHLQQMVQQPQQQFQQPAPQQQQQQAQQQPAQQRTGWNWQRPDESVGAIVKEQLNEMVESRLMPMLAPIAADRAMASVNNARAQAAHAIGVQNFALIEPEVMQVLSGAHPQALMDPRTWQTAAAVVIGNRTMRGQPLQQPQQQQQQGPGAYPAQMVQPGQNPMPNLNTFFSEQPYQGGPGGQGIQLTPMQRAAASAMGITESDYAAWSVGTNPRTV